jgi:3-phosphoshikimate 1-carboxyvinyltransferase
VPGEPLGGKYAIHLRIRIRADCVEEGVKRSIVYRMPVSSAQVKSAILLASLKLRGTYVSEPVATRDHTERLLEHLQIGKGTSIVPAFEYTVPGDPSTAAFFVAGALMQKDSEIMFQNVLMNRHRIGYIHKLLQAGASIEVSGRGLLQNEYVADLRVRSGKNLTRFESFLRKFLR